MRNTGNLKVTTPTEREIVMSRVFDAPRRLVWDAFHQPSHCSSAGSAARLVAGRVRGRSTGRGRLSLRATRARRKRDGDARRLSGDRAARSLGSHGVDYANVNGLRCTDEVHGTGKPLVVLHGAFGWATVFPTLARNRQSLPSSCRGMDTPPISIAR